MKHRSGIIYTTTDYSEKLDTISGTLFFIGVIFSKLQYLAPIPLLGLCCNIIGLLLYLAGYALWIITSRISPDDRRNKELWIGFTSLKQQFTIASTIGLASTLLGVAAIFMPILIVPTCWLLAISNLWWCFGEYQKMKTPPEPGAVSNYSPGRQQAYFKYVMTILVLSILTAMITTIMVFTPGSFLIFLMISPYLGGVAIKAYIDNFLKPNTSQDASTQTTEDLATTSLMLDQLQQGAASTHGLTHANRPPAPRNAPSVLQLDEPPQNAAETVELLSPRH